MRSYLISAAAVIIVCVFAVPNLTHASTTWYANSSTGNDSNAGTSTSPFKTFTKAYASSTAGDTINLTGTFDWTNTGETGTSSPNGFTIGKNLTITGQSASMTFVQAANASNTAQIRVFTINTGVTATIENLNIRNGRTKVGFGYYGGGIQNNGTLYLIADEIDNNVSDNGGAGVDNLDLLYVASSTIDNNLCNGATGMGCGVLSDYNIVAGGYTTITDSTIAYNTITATTGYYSGAGIHFRNGSGTLTNDTISENASCESSVGMDTSAGILTIKNTIIANNLYHSGSFCSSGIPINFAYRTSGQGNVVDNGNNVIGYSPLYYTWAGSGDWYQSTNGGAFTLHGSSATGTVNLASTLAQNNSLYGTPTFSLSAGSVAIDNGATGSNGATSTVPSLDQRGASRVGSSTDIGAYEYNGLIAGVPEPQISAVASTTGTTTATITWTTDETASSSVSFGTSTAYGSASTSQTLVTSHTIILTGLATSTTYHFQVASADGSNNVATSSDYTFLTTTPPDTTPPVVTVLTPVSGSTASGTAVLLSASSSDNVAVAGVTFYINGTKIGSETTSSSTIFSENWDSTATSSGSYSIIAVARDTSNNYTTSSPAINFTVLNSGETPTLVSSVVSATSTRITWTTSVAASSQVFFGPSTFYGSSTSRIDTSPMVTNHSVMIYTTVPCVLYHYEVVSQNIAGDSATSSDQTFNTTGCTGSSTISAVVAGSIATSTGGIISGTGVKLIVPTGFTATSSSVTFQANALATSTFFSAAGTPAGLNAAGSVPINLTAFVDASTTISTFTSPLTVTLSYQPSDISGLNPNSLWIYRYDFGVWTALSGCVTDTVAMTVSCTTSNFSDFALFGQAASGSSGNSGGGGGSVQSEYAALLAMGATAQANQLKAQYSWLFANGTTTTTSSAVKTSPVFSAFTRSLHTGTQGSDVTRLQHFLNAQGFEVASSGPGSLGNETDYFGALTKSALEKFQTANASVILSPAGLKVATGIFGLYTMSAVNAILKGN